MKFNITITDIRALGPCYDPSRYLPENWSGTLIDILENKDIPPQDRLWVVRTLVDTKTIQKFAVEAAKLAQTYPKALNKSADQCILMTEAYLAGLASIEDVRKVYIEIKYDSDDTARAAVIAVAAAYAAVAYGDTLFYAAVAVDYANYAAADAADAADAETARLKCRTTLCLTLVNLIKEAL